MEENKDLIEDVDLAPTIDVDRILSNEDLNDTTVLGSEVESLDQE